MRVFHLLGGMGLAVGKVIVMSLFGFEGAKAVIADIGFTIAFGSVGYETRHVSDPSVMSRLDTMNAEGSRRNSNMHPAQCLSLFRQGSSRNALDEFMRAS